MLIISALLGIIFFATGWGLHTPSFSGGVSAPKPGVRPPYFLFPSPFLLMPIFSMFRSWTTGLLAISIYFAYWWLLDGVFGKSLGRWIFGLHVRQLTGRKTGLAAAALESLGKAVLPMLDVVLGLLIPEARNRKQRVTHYLTGTVVLRKNPPEEIELGRSRTILS
jgi:uncharacterized RDD family membrane protein YckC